MAVGQGKYMRNFDDEQGRHWQAALLDGSYGSTWVVFSRLGDDGVRKAELSAENMRLAERELLDMDTAQLRALLASSEPWS